MENYEQVAEWSALRANQLRQEADSFITQATLYEEHTREIKELMLAAEVAKGKMTINQAREELGYSATKVVSCKAHVPVQHRDGKEPWCEDCGLNSDYVTPYSLFKRR